MLPAHQGIPNIQAYLYTEQCNIGGALGSELTEMYVANILFYYIFTIVLVVSVWVIRKYEDLQHFNPLKTKRRLLYLKTQFVPRSKHFSSRL